MKPSNLEYAEVRSSKIHNKGVFAKKDIPKGTKVIEYVGKKVTKKQSDDIYEKSYEESIKNPEKGAVYIFELNKRYDIDGNVSWNIARLINHSCDPNCETDIIKGKIWIISTRDIKKGEEITYNYGYDLDNWKDHPCKCGSKKCVGYITDEKNWSKLKKKIEKESTAKS